MKGRFAMNRELLEKPFDPSQIKQRKGSFGDVLDYIEGSTVIQRLNEAFDGDWIFEIVDHHVYDDEVVVLGKLTAAHISKSQFGKSRITRATKDNAVISLGDDLKAAATDSLKKCATLFGVGLHLYFDPPKTNGSQPSSNDRNPNKSNGPPTDDGRLTAKQLSAIFSLAKSKGWSNKDVREFTQEMFGKLPDFLNRKEASAVITHLSGGNTHD
jgi:hypothetical protein